MNEANNTNFYGRLESDFNDKINSLYERALRITYGGKKISFYNRNIQAPAFEMFKVKNDIAPELMKELFAPKMQP